jgi:hypothetical protein
MRTTAAVTLVALATVIGGRANADTAPSQKATTTQKTMKVEPKAQQTLHAMSEFMAKQKAFEVDVKGSTEVIDEKGQKVQFKREGHVWVERPNKVRSDRKGELVDAQIFYDGKTLTVFAKNANAYAQRPAPATIDATVSELYDKVDLELGPGDILSANAEKTLMEEVTSGRVVESVEVEGVKTTHIAAQGAEVDWDLWIAEGDKPLPHKYVITSKKVEGAPQYAVTLTNWKLVNDIDDATFKFEPPKDAKKISFLDQIKTKKPTTPKKKE